MKKYDAFIVSKCIAPQVPHWGGKAFREAGKEPFVCDMKTRLFKKVKEVKSTIRSTQKNVSRFSYQLFLIA